MSEGEERDRKKRAKNLFKEIIAKSFSNILERQKKEEDIQVQETQRISNKIKPKRSTPRHIIIKMANKKKRQRENLKSRKIKTASYVQGNSQRAIS